MVLENKNIQNGTLDFRVIGLDKRWESDAELAPYCRAIYTAAFAIADIQTQRCLKKMKEEHHESESLKLHKKRAKNFIQTSEELMNQMLASEISKEQYRAEMQKLNAERLLMLND